VQNVHVVGVFFVLGHFSLFTGYVSLFYNTILMSLCSSTLTISAGLWLELLGFTTTLLLVAVL